MKLQYEISTWTSSTAMEAFAYAKRQRKDSALGELWRQIFDMISGQAGRDTKRGWQLKEEFEAFAREVETKPLRHGYERHKRFVWRNDPHGICEHVDFFQRRI